jgi:hypothetical protein
MPIQPGEIFSRAKVAKGLEALHQHYDSAAYVNFTSIPNTEYDEADASIRLRIDVDEGKLFRWGELHITGLDAEKTQRCGTDGKGCVENLIPQRRCESFVPRFFGQFRSPRIRRSTRKEN